MGSKKNKIKYRKKKNSIFKGLCKRAKAIIKFNRKKKWNILIFISKENESWIPKPTTWTNFEVHIVKCNSDVITVLNSYKSNSVSFKSIVFAPDHGCDQSGSNSTIKWSSKYNDIGYENTLPICELAASLTDHIHISTCETGCFIQEFQALIYNRTKLE